MTGIPPSSCVSTIRPWVSCRYARFLGPLRRAKKRIYLTSVYFVPSQAIKNALADAARRGADVQVLFPKQSTYALVDSSSITKATTF